MTLEPWPAAAVKLARFEAPRDAGRVRGYELAIRRAPFERLRASYPRAVAGCGAGGNIFDPEDWCDVFAAESVYMRSGCLAMSRERSARLIVRSKSIMDDKKRILVEAAVEYGGYELAVRKVPFERLSISYLCAAAGSVLVVMSLIADIVATPLPRRMASASSASVAGLLVVLPLILEIRSDACGMRDRHSPPTPRVLAVSTRRHGATQRCTGRLLGRIRLGQV